MSLAYAHKSGYKVKMYTDNLGDALAINGTNLGKYLMLSGESEDYNMQSLPTINVGLTPFVNITGLSNNIYEYTYIDAYKNTKKTVNSN